MLLSKFTVLIGGTFRIDSVGSLMAQGDLVAVSLHFQAEKPDASMSMSGMDLLRVRDGLIHEVGIHEVGLFSEDQLAEDRFWG